MRQKDALKLGGELTPYAQRYRRVAPGAPALLADAQQREILQQLARLGVERHGRGDARPFQLTTHAWASIDALLGEADAQATTRSYAAARRQFMAWWLLTYARPFALPVPPEAVAQFIADFTNHDDMPRSADADWVDDQLVKAGVKAGLGPIRYSTLKQRVAAVASWHLDAEQVSPFASPLVKKALRAARRIASYQGDLKPKRREGLSRDSLLKLLDSCDDTDIGVRDRALLLFAWGTGGRRPSEVANADIRQLFKVDGGYIYRLTQSKTIKPGMAHREMPLTGAVAEAMSDWLERREALDESAHAEAVAKAVRSGDPPPGRRGSPSIFRAFRGPSAGRGLTARAVGDVIARRCAIAGVEGNFGGHSARRGWVTQAWTDGLKPSEIMELSTHGSITALLVYDESGKVLESPAADLLKGPLVRRR